MIWLARGGDKVVAAPNTTGVGRLPTKLPNTELDKRNRRAAIKTGSLIAGAYYMCRVTRLFRVYMYNRIRRYNQRKALRRTLKTTISGADS